MDKIITRGEMFWASLGENKGSEQGGIRPVVIIQNNSGNKFSPTVIIATITSQIGKKKLPTHVPLSALKYEKLNKDSTILVEQIRTIDKSRLGDYIGSLTIEDRKKLDRAIEVSVDLTEYLERIKDCLIFSSDIRSKDIVIKKWIDIGGEIRHIEDELKSRIELIGEFEKYCSRFNMNMEEYYIDEMRSNKIKKVV